MQGDGEGILIVMGHSTDKTGDDKPTAQSSRKGERKETVEL